MRPLPFFINQLLVFVQNHDFIGKYKLYELTKHRCRNLLIKHKISGKDFFVPWDQWCFWLNYGPSNYYLEEISPFAHILNTQFEAFDFFDLGADVGVVSALVNKNCPGVKRIFAFEPNPSSFQVLTQNLACIDPSHEAYNQAISDFTGYCHFNFDLDTGSDHAGYLATSEHGDTRVNTFDNVVAELGCSVHENIAIKIDVEGQELATFAGAKEQISLANKVVIFLELHPSVLEREGHTPEMLFEAVESIRAFKWLVPLHNNQEVDRSKDFFSQFKKQQYDVIAIAE